VARTNPGEALAPAESEERSEAYFRAYELVVDVQSPVPGAAEEIQRLIKEAQERGWNDVVRVALFAAAVAAHDRSAPERLAAIQRLLVQAEQDGAAVMVALALAMRASETGAGDPNFALAADDDLARATVILETVAEGNVLERISAHNSCAQAYSARWLWELCDEQYAAAMKLAPDTPAPWSRLVLPAIVYNRVEMQVDWACVLRQLGDRAGVVERRLTWETAMTTALTVEMPAQWTVELESLGLLLSATAGLDVADAARAKLAVVDPRTHAGAWPAGWLHLAVALSDQVAGRIQTAAEAAELAVAGIDPRGSADPYDLALYIAAELEANGRSTPSLRYAHRQLSLRWAHRLAVLGSMLGRVQAERLRREHDVVTQQAHLDDLTALLNRRGFARYLESLSRQDVGAISLLVADLDNFKMVNDHYGHQIGDTVLVNVGRLLQAHVRQSDCAVRLGGDEFAIVLASAGLDVARRRAEALTHAVRRQPWDKLAPGLAITVSVGLAAGTTAEFPELIERADRALYEAKRSGRGTVVCDVGETSENAWTP
jgi:diguanylate cyclase (GGDEF)-like protein